MKRIHIIELQGGLGNQMFQYAFLIGMRHLFEKDIHLFEIGTYKTDLNHNGFELDSIFGIQAPPLNSLYWGGKIRKLPSMFRELYRESVDGRYENIIPRKKRRIIYYTGYWQSEKYFRPYRKEILSTFVFPQEKISAQNIMLSHQMEQQNSVSLHIRGGDYIRDPDAYAVLGEICTPDYYRQALALLEQKIGRDYQLYVFTNDMGYASQNFDLPNACFITHNSGYNSWQDMYLMSKCKHNIVANSSFSWWAGWLGENPDKIVIAPDRWFKHTPGKDVICDHWLTIKV